MKFQKKYLFAIIPLFLVVSVLAVGYIVNQINLTVGVKEPFVVQYAVIGDMGTYTGGTCANESLNWFTSDSTSIPTGGFYPLESRAVCVRIENKGEVSIPYTITSRVTNDNQAGDCVHAFANQDLSGSAIHGINYNGAVIKIAANAVPVEGCNVEISVARGA
jgi:hypothetical protein